MNDNEIADIESDESSFHAQGARAHPEGQGVSGWSETRRGRLAM